MLDNFGLMEFLVLAFMALLFFGPERLPQMGAKLGRWLTQLTQYSKTFMTQWSDEALAIQDAVSEVRGIREEIRAAQAEISSSLNTARQDITDTIDVAKSQIREAQPNPQAFIEGQPQLRPSPLVSRPTASAESAGDDEAISKTQAILADLQAKRGSVTATEQGMAVGAEATAPALSSAEAEAPEAVSTRVAAGVQPVLEPVDKVDLSAVAEKAEGKQTESAFDRTQRVLNRLMGKPDDEGVASAQEPASESAAEAEPVLEDAQDAPAQQEPAEAPGPAPILALNATPSQTSAGTEHPTATAFDRTQRVLDKLLGKEVPPEEEPAPVSTAHADAVASSGLEEGELEPAPLARTPPDQRFEEISVQVTMMRSELRALRRELRALEDELKARTASASSADSMQGAASMEEAA